MPVVIEATRLVKRSVGEFPYIQSIVMGPLNIASFLLGTTEFLMAIRTNPDETHQLLTTITDFIVDWLQCQKECLPSIEGIFVLDDIVQSYPVIRDSMVAAAKEGWRSVQNSTSISGGNSWTTWSHSSRR